MSIELYWGSGSTPAWRALLGFAFKGQPYTSHLLSFSAGDTRKPAFQQINPRGKVPAIREGDFTLGESLAILAWLEARFPEGPHLFGADANTIGAVWRAALEYENHAGPAFSAVARPLLFRQETTTEALLAAAGAVEEELDRLNAALAPTGALVGEALTAADLVWYCGLRFLERGLSRPWAAAHNLPLAPLFDRWPALRPWAARIEALPGFLATVPPHWLEGDHPSPARLTD